MAAAAAGAISFAHISCPSCIQELELLLGTMPTGSSSADEASAAAAAAAEAVAAAAAVEAGGEAEAAEGEGQEEEAVLTVLAAISRVLGGSQPLSILCTGYGVGGALAELGAVRLALLFPHAETTCVTFGSPV